MTSLHDEDPWFRFSFGSDLSVWSAAFVHRGSAEARRGSTKPALIGGKERWRARNDGLHHRSHTPAAGNGEGRRWQRLYGPQVRNAEEIGWCLSPAYRSGGWSVNRRHSSLVNGRRSADGTEHARRNNNPLSSLIRGERATTWLKRSRQMTTVWTSTTIIVHLSVGTLLIWSCVFTAAQPGDHQCKVASRSPLLCYAIHSTTTTIAIAVTDSRA
ncbi:unnamed protein product [Soboliphyme baturini]|uniref:Uncharacterized protein n=1 Tax=Soboliphyme baturini TaxID=241478 RepID=A0A183J982_9BILA|nr:unnamed protein product [Soboliphyme baturini]